MLRFTLFCTLSSLLTCSIYFYLCIALLCFLPLQLSNTCPLLTLLSLQCSILIFFAVKSWQSRIMLDSRRWWIGHCIYFNFFSHFLCAWYFFTAWLQCFNISNTLCNFTLLYLSGIDWSSCLFSLHSTLLHEPLE